jgi:hypothetical protein
MNWSWATSIDQVWRSPIFPMWLTLLVAGFFGIIVIITLWRAEKSVANGALTVITLLAVGIAGAATIRGFGPGGQSEQLETPSSASTSAALPALSCLDELAGEAVLAGCEKALFGSAETVAAAVSYAATRIARLTAIADITTANPNIRLEMQALRHAVERDRYGLVAQALIARDHCTPSECEAFGALTDSRQIVSNMNERVYDGLILRYAPSWNAPTATGPVAASLAPSVPTGKPTNADFPTATSIPPVSIMNPEPGAAPSPARPPASSATATAPLPSPRPASAASAAPGAAKRQPPPKSARASTPVQLAPAPPATVPAATTE